MKISLFLAAVVVLAPWHFGAVAAIEFAAFRVVHVAQDAWTKTESPDQASAYTGGEK